MIRVSYARPIRKRPRKFHKFVPILSLENDCGDCDVCSECVDNYAAQAEHDRPGHVWAVDNGHLVYLEDTIAESILGRPLKDTEMVIHKNDDPLDNRRENIEVVEIPDMGPNKR